MRKPRRNNQEPLFTSLPPGSTGSTPGPARPSPAGSTRDPGNFSNKTGPPAAAGAWYSYDIDGLIRFFQSSIREKIWPEFLND